MPEDPVALLRRAAEQLPPPRDAMERTVRRRMRRSRTTTIASAGLALIVFVAGLAVVLRAFSGSAGPGVGHPTVPPPQGSAPKGIGSVQMIRAFGTKEAVALTDHAVIRTPDGGIHWTSVSPPGFPEFASSSMFYLDARHGWIVSLPKEKNGTVSVFRTTNKGSTWSEASLRLAESLDYDAFAAGHAQPPELGFSDPLHGWLRLPVTPSPLFVTSDGGATWEPGPLIDQAIDAPGNQLQALTFTSPSRGWAVREHDVPLDSSSDLPIHSLYRTLDGGETWQRIDLPAPPMSFGESQHGPAIELGLPRFFGPDDGVMAAWFGTRVSSGLFVYVTRDGGATWSVTGPIPIHQGRGSPIFTPALASDRVWMVASASGELAVTTDAGRSWSVRSLRSVKPYGYAAALEFTSARNGWALGCENWSGGLATPTSCDGRFTLYRTTDGGRSWTLMLTNLPTGRA